MPSFPTISRTFSALLSFLRSLSLFCTPHPPPAPEPHKPHREHLQPASAIKNLEGKLIASYKFITELDRGTFAAVYHCKHIHTHRFYAAKVYTPQWIRTKTGNDVIHQELTVMKLLNHPNTTFFQDVIFTNIGVIIVMELVEGKTLLDILPPGDGVMEHFARHIFLQFLQGLQYLHRNRILHRDIKLENVMIDFQGNIKIIDYGMAKYIPKSNNSHQLLVTDRCGSKNYFAPEIYSGASTPFRGDKTDIWTSGVLLFCLVTGSFPFHHDHEEQMEKLVMNCESWITHWTKTHATVSPELKDLFRKIFVKDPMKRPSVAELRIHPWTTGTKICTTNERVTVFTSKSGNVSATFADRKAQRSLSCVAMSPRVATSLQGQIGHNRKANITHASSTASPANFSPEPKIEEVENQSRSYETVSIASQSPQRPRKKLGKLLHNICDAPKRIYNKIRARKEERKQDKRDRNESIVQDRQNRKHRQDAEERRATIIGARNEQVEARFLERNRRRAGSPVRFWSRRGSRKPIEIASVSRLRSNASILQL